MSFCQWASVGSFRQSTAACAVILPCLGDETEQGCGIAVSDALRGRLNQRCRVGGGISRLLHFTSAIRASFESRRSIRSDCSLVFRERTADLGVPFLFGH